MHQLLPMFGQTHGNRSAVTCHLKCGSACAYAPPNNSTEPSFADIASTQLSRRSVLIGTGALAAAAVLPVAFPEPAAAAGKTARAGGLSFIPIEPVPDGVDAFTVPQGYQWKAILRWGDPLFDDSPAFNPERPNAEAQERQFGYNNDYLDILVTDRVGRHALLCCNHEYTNRNIMFPPASGEAELEPLKTTMAATGFAVVELVRSARGRPWRYVRDGKKNRRLTAYSLFQLTGPAAGSDLVKTGADPEGRWVLGTFGNCAGGTTPWGTILSGEENVTNYFVATGTSAEEARYGLRDEPTSYGWEKVDKRFNAKDSAYTNEPNRFGYIVEIDPENPRSVPRKHTAMGRFKHEGANIRIDRDGTVVAYMGDDERFDYLYKFVAKNKYRPGKSAAARRHNKRLLSEGDLYVARFRGTENPDGTNLGTGTWLPLTRNGDSAVPGMTVEQVLVYTRLAADLVKPTPMDRCEDVEPNLATGKVYVACTNNTDRGKPGKRGSDAANPRGLRATPPVGPNKDGHVIEITETRNKAAATTFDWNIFLLCGDPADPKITTYFAGWDGPVAPISCPDNLAFDSTGDTLWIATDGAPGTIKYADGLFAVPLTGPERGHVAQFLAVPEGAETCGPVIHDRDGSVFVAVQHPGEDGDWDAQTSWFPDYVEAGEKPDRGDWRGPRPSVVQVTRQRS